MAGPYPKKHLREDLVLACIIQVKNAFTTYIPYDRAGNEALWNVCKACNIYKVNIYMTIMLNSV